MRWLVQETWVHKVAWHVECPASKHDRKQQPAWQVLATAPQDADSFDRTKERLPSLSYPWIRPTTARLEDRPHTTVAPLGVQSRDKCIVGALENVENERALDATVIEDRRKLVTHSHSSGLRFLCPDSSRKVIDVPRSLQLLPHLGHIQPHFVGIPRVWRPILRQQPHRPPIQPR